MKVFCECIVTRHPDSQSAKIQIRVASLKRFAAPGSAKIIRVH